MKGGNGMKLKEKGFYKGVNLGGWLSQCDYSEEHLDAFITEKDLSVISSWDVDHVRIPLDYNILETDTGSYLESGFARIDRALEWCGKNGLNAILDLHKTAGYSFDSEEREEGFFESETLQHRFLALWEEISRRYGSLSRTVAFELLNEVTDRKYIEQWNKISYECIRKIRVHAPETLILVGSYWNNSAEAVKDLAPPYDENIVYNMHCYEPLRFTHQGANWTDKINPDERVGFDESGITPAYFEALFSSAVEAAKKNHTALYCGEYGVIENCSAEDTLKWFRAIHEVFEKLEISRSVWSYKEMNFGLTDPRFDDVRDELIRYL